jgi:hypothetical protein
VSEAALFGDLEAVTVAWLKPRLIGVKVATEVPNPRPGELVKVSITGGSTPNRVTERTQLTLECWAVTSIRASEICRTARAMITAMDGEMINGVFIRRVQTVGGPVFFPDPDSDRPRYQTTMLISHRFTGVLNA